MPADLTATTKVERKPKLSEHVAASLRSQILSGEILSGAKLPTESQLTDAFGVSRTVVREAVASLAADGLVEPRQGAGIFVCQRPAMAFASITQDLGLKISHALNVIEVRMGLEIESAGLAAGRRNAAQEAMIQEAFFEFDRLLSIGEATGRSDFMFHRSIAAATNNPFYVEVLDALGVRAIPCDITSPWGTDSVLTREYQATLQREHLAILKAISAGDADAARMAMRAHLMESQRRYHDRLTGQQADYQFGSNAAP
ncbi:FadR/GntR family transcriptional regulator [Pseudorhizobium marinum]|jgi:GntR family transcriptional regulator, transcriptional repressor for pyruvate dehydrogenase complex|uniref:FadR/GntR family transcriptional regulator n=1 Tax=Pseudorhizobium marinum TaxID=1496690 RepID=UPI00049516AD|nr:FadR/GntR family transcriptional regulator [Pseudorhizobium marinum]